MWWQTAQYWWSITRDWLDSNAFSHGGALAFYTLFSLAPVVIIAVSGYCREEVLLVDDCRWHDRRRSPVARSTKCA